MRRPLPNAADPAADGVELAWLRRTDAVADPVILAQSLCGEIAPLVSAERVNYLTTHDGRSQLIASSTTAIIDPRSTEAARLSQLADEVCRTGTDVLTDPTSTDPAATSADATETLAIPVMTDESVDQVQGVIVIQRYAPQPTLLFDAIAAFRSEIDAAAAKVAAALRWRATTTEPWGRRSSGSWNPLVWPCKPLVRPTRSGISKPKSKT